MKNKEPTIIESLPSVAEFSRLRAAVGWGKIDERTVEIGLRNSLYSVCAKVGQEVVGCCRLVGDGAMKIYVEELMIHPDYQRQGIGTELMQAIMVYLRKTYGKGCTVGLFSNKGLDAYYARFGFDRRREDMPGMVLAL